MKEKTSEELCVYMGEKLLLYNAKGKFAWISPKNIRIWFFQFLVRIEFGDVGDHWKKYDVYF